MILQEYINQSLSTTLEVVVGTLVGGIISLIIARWKERNHLEKCIAELQASINALQAKMEDDIKDVKAEVKKEMADLKEAESASMRHTIRIACEDAIKTGWISFERKEDILNITNQYEKIVLKNGYINSVVKTMCELPNEEPEKKS